MTLKFYYDETPNPRKACAVIKHLGSSVDYIHVSLAKGEQRTSQFLAINPNGKVPVLDTGRTRLWEANAIMCYLARLEGSDLWPEDDRQIEVMRWLSWDSQHFTRHAGSLYFQNVVKPALRLGEPDRAAVDEASGFFKRFAGVLDEHLKGRSFLVGNGLTVADFAVGMMLPYAKPARLPLDGFAEIERWHARLNELPAWREPFPDREGGRVTPLRGGGLDHAAA